RISKAVFPPDGEPKYFDRSNPPVELTDVQRSELATRVDKNSTSFADGTTETDLGGGRTSIEYPEHDALGRISAIKDSSKTITDFIDRVETTFTNGFEANRDELPAGI